MPSKHNQGLGWVGKKASKPLGRDEQLELVEAAQKGSQEARDKLVNGWLAYVLKTAMHYAQTSDRILVEDLLQIGIVGLLEAINRFTVGRRGEDGKLIAFGTYAPYLIRQKIIEEIDTRIEVIRVASAARRRKSPEVRQDAKRVLDGILPLDAGEDHQWSVQDRGRGRQQAVHGDASILRDYIKEREAFDAQRAQTKKLKRAIKSIRDPNIRQAMIYRLEGWLLEDIGELMGYSKTRASDWVTEGLEILKKKMTPRKE